MGRKAMKSHTAARIIVHNVSLQPKRVSLKAFAAYDNIIYASKMTVTANSLILKLMIVLLLSSFITLIFVKVRFFSVCF
jgi:hypothetical protein